MELFCYHFLMQPNINNDIFFYELVKNNLLSVSPDGKVFNNKTGKELGRDKNNKYSTVGYYDGIKNTYIQKHRLIWIAFNGLIPKGLVINHKDGIKSNNSLDNLEVVTYSENQSHALENGLALPTIKLNMDNRVKELGYIGKCTTNKLSIEQVNEIREKTKEYVRGLDSIIAKEYGVGRITVSSIRRNKCWLTD